MHCCELSNTWNFPVLWFALRGTFWKWIRGRISRFCPEATTGLSSELNYNYRPTEWHINHASQSVSRNVFAPLNLNKQRAGDPDSDKDVKEPREREMGLFEPERVWMGRRGLEHFPDASDPLSARRRPAVSAGSYFNSVFVFQLRIYRNERLWERIQDAFWLCSLAEGVISIVKERRMNFFLIRDRFVVRLIQVPSAFWMILKRCYMTHLQCIDRHSLRLHAYMECISVFLKRL